MVVVLVSGGGTPGPGYDVSFPQCSGGLPANPRFGIVGVDDGLADNTNPCLARQISWAEAAPGQTRPFQPRLSFYINTGNPGLQSASWPRTGTAPAYGACNDRLTDACSYLYGQQRAAASFRQAAGHAPVAARSAPWWLDVEEQSSWAHTYALNVAALQGFVAGLRTAGVTGAVGIYSTAAQWRDLTGLTSQTTHTAFHTVLPDWLAGTTLTLPQARTNCAGVGFTGAAPSLAQYQLDGHDADLRCT